MLKKNSTNAIVKIFKLTQPLEVYKVNAFFKHALTFVLNLGVKNADID